MMKYFTRFNNSIVTIVIYVINNYSYNLMLAVYV